MTAGNESVRKAPVVDRAAGRWIRVRRNYQGSGDGMGSEFSMKHTNFAKE